MASLPTWFGDGDGDRVVMVMVMGWFLEVTLLTLLTKPCTLPYFVLTTLVFTWKRSRSRRQRRRKKRIRMLGRGGEDEGADAGGHAKLLTSSVTMLGLRWPADMQSVASTSSPTTTTLIILQQALVVVSI